MSQTMSDTSEERCSVGRLPSCDSLSAFDNETNQNSPLLPINTDVAAREQDTAFPMDLCVLFGINGFTLALASTALLSIVNDRAKIPFEIMPSYAAIAFLPWSLKPVYSFLSESMPHIPLRTQIACLLVFSATLYSATDWLIPENGIAMCFVVAFVRAFFGAWPEFLLGLLLIDEARSHPSFGVSSLLYQAQAATSRTVGSLVAHGVSLALYAFVSPTLANRVSLHMTSLCTLGGALVLWKSCCGGQRRQSGELPLEIDQEVDDDRDGDFESLAGSYHSCSSSSINTDSNNSVTTMDQSDEQNQTGSSLLLMCLLQAVVILFALKQPVVNETSEMGWTFLVVLAVVALMRVACDNQQPQTRVGIFLILRHAVPSVSYLMDSYVYRIFLDMSKAFMVPLLSVLNMAVSALASWSFGRFLNPLGGCKHGMMWLLGGTTSLSAVGLLGTSRLISLLRSDREWIVVLAAVGIQLVMGFIGEYSFLPSVVLATKASDGNHLRYGALLSCIDFGGQIGALLLTPLLALWTTDRDHYWLHLDDFQAMQALVTFFSIGLLLLLRL